MDFFIKLKEWLNMQNDHLHMYETEFRGIYSDEDIKENDIILFIPQEYIIDYWEIRYKKLKGLLNRNSHLVLFLYMEMNKKKSFYQPWFDCFPKKMNHFIDFYPKKEWNQLKHTSLACKNEYSIYQKIEDMKKDSQIMYDYLIEKKKIDNQKITKSDFYKDYVKLKNTVDSRLFSYDKGGKETYAMVPYADLFNHSLDSNTYWYFNDEKNQFEMMATQDIPKNTQIYDSYGDKSNLKLLFFYGFTIPNNPFSFLCIDKPNSDDTYKFTIKSKIIKKKDCKYILSTLKKIYNHHIKYLHQIQKEDIKNIYLDEIKIIEQICKKEKMELWKDNSIEGESNDIE